MQLSQLLEPWIDTDRVDCVISDISNDSRSITAGALFIAYPGAAADGRVFIDKAVCSGAAAIAYDPCNLPASVHLPTSIPCVAIDNLAEQLAQIAQRFYQHPGANVQVTGITGTNGKTTIAYQLAQAHSLLGEKTAYIGTIGQGDVNSLKPLDNTTPDALCLQRLLYQYREQGFKKACMEVSSHALSQHRVDAIAFRQAIFTNLTLDHLDYHHTMEAYAAAKAQLFMRDELECAIINSDDKYHQLIKAAVKPKTRTLTYGIDNPADIRVTHWQMDLQGTHIDVESPWGRHSLHIKALGKFNIYNSLAVFASLLVSGYAPEQVVRIMAELKAAPGRLELVAQAPYVLVDYAHTPDALENALITLNQIKKAKLWVIFGCGGDRDTSKRPIMGHTAGIYADKVIITSDNPRSEDPLRIIDDVAAGVVDKSKLTTLVNREEAILHTLNLADKNDIVLIAGKGHEAYQQIGAVKHPFSDQELVKKIMQHKSSSEAYVSL